MRVHPTSIVGVLPMAGSGSRLGLPFHKALAPTLTPAGVEPLYAHAYDRLRRVADRIVFVLSAEGDRDPCLDGLPGERYVKTVRGELPTSLAMVSKYLHPDTLVAVALPDSMWWPADGFSALVRECGRRQPLDGVLGLFRASSHVLDRVTIGADGLVGDITRHADPPAPEEEVAGWGALVASAGCLRGLRDDHPLAPQLAEYRFAAHDFATPYFDLGTPERYAAYHDLPLRMG